MALNYSEALAFARNLHPKAKVRLIQGKWEIIISTDIPEFKGVSDSWKGTPAEEAYATLDEHGDPILDDYAAHEGISNQLLEAIAARYNLHHARRETFQARWAVAKNTEDAKNLKVNDLTAYRAIRDTIWEEVEDEYIEKEYDFDDKLDEDLAH